MAELKFLKGAYSAYTAKTSYDDNSFYVTMEPVGEKTMYALWLGKNLIASGNTVAALEAEITRAEAAELALSNRIAAFEGTGEGSVKDQIAKLEEALEQQIADEKAAREAAVSALTEDIEDLNADLNDEISARSAADTFLSGKIDTNIVAIETLNGGADKEGSVAKAVADAKSELLGDAANDYNTLGKLEDKIQEVEGAAKSYEIAVVTGDELSALGTNVREAYKLVDEDKAKVGEYIKIYKDSSLKSVALDGQTLNFTYILADGSESTVGVDVSSFLVESEFANGLQVVDNVVSVKVAEGSEDFLTVDANGIKLAGVQDAIDDAVEAEKERAEGVEADLDAAIKAEAKTRGEEITRVEGLISAEKNRAESAETELNNAITAETSARESEITRVEGLISAEETRAISAETALDARLDVLESGENSVAAQIEAAKNYASGLVADEAAARVSADTELNTAITTEKNRAESAETELNNAITAETYAREAADQAINDKIGAVAEGKTVVEMINDAKAAATAAHTKVAKDGEAAHITLTSTTDEAGAVTYTIGESDIASKSVMDQKIADIESDINFLISGGTLEGTLESIKEIDEYLKAHEGEAGDMLAAIQANATAISDETEARKAAVKEEKERAEAVEAFLSGAIDTEVAERKAAVSSETDARVAADNVLSGKIDTEITNRETADEALSDRLDAIEAVTVTGKDAIVVSASSATDNKEISLKLVENQVDAAGAGIKLTQDDNGLKATMEWGTF